MNKKVILMILDGWGITQDPKVSAIYNAKTPYINSLYDKYPHAELRTDGEHVGLPEGQMGNSEVGHMNLGAGRIVYQNLARINKAVKEKTLGKEKVLLDTFKYAKENNKNVHLLGLVSNGGIHSHINHLKGILDIAKENDVNNVFLHAFTDGRDCDPKSGAFFIDDMQKYMQKTTGELASITGRYYAMDRDNRWERIKETYNCLVNAIGTKTSDAITTINKNYDNNITDEFLKPIIITNEDGTPKTTIKEGDAVIFFNYRTDRGRELTNALSQNDFPDFGMQKLDLYFTTMTLYDESFTGINVIYNNDNIKNTLGEVLSKAGKKQIRIAETEKYPHVTFFFSGGQESPFKGESRILKNSPKVATYDLKPEMAAYELTDALCIDLKKREADFVCLNFANGDMVGHTGIMEAAIKACEAVDVCAKTVIETGLANGYSTLLIADHGNCETMINPDGSPHTAHTTNPVPFILIDDEIKSIKNGILGDVSPTILELIGVTQPKEMTQKSLFITMKHLIILFSSIIFVACNANKSTVEKKAEEIVRQKVNEVTAQKNDRGYLIGIANKESFNDESYKSWFDSRYKQYNTDKEVIAKIKENINNYTIKGFMGTWCGDSKRETPRFYKVLEETGFDLNYFELITVDRNKKTPDNLQEGFNVVRVPTFIFYKNGKEVGRYVEYPRETIEKDILKIITAEPYKHSYDKSE